MPKLHIRFTGTSIRNRVAITVVATVVVISMVGTALSGREHAARLMADLKAESQVLASVFGDTLSDALWDYDYELVQLRLDHLASTGSISGARVLDIEGDKLAEVMIEGFDPATSVDQLVFGREIVAETGEAIGTLFLWVSSAGVSTEVWKAVRDDATTAAILAVITAVVVFVGGVSQSGGGWTEPALYVLAAILAAVLTSSPFSPTGARAPTNPLFSCRDFASEGFSGQGREAPLRGYTP